MPFIDIGDIVSVNGKPARGAWLLQGRVITLFPSPTPGQAIGDLGRGAMADLHLEVLQSDGTRVGTIMTSGFTAGPAPPGSPAGSFGNFTVTGGTGAFLGARGFSASPPAGFRSTSMAEDPANRRINGGLRGHFIVYLIPLFRPEVVSAAGGPAVFHADFSQVTAVRPARAGETLIVRATGLGPTRSGLISGTPFPENPFEEVNSPVEMAVNGKPVDVLNKVGWPGTTDACRLDFRVPDGTPTGTASLQVTAAFISVREVSVPIQ